MGRERNIAMSLPGFEQSMFMAAQPGHNYIATAPHYCHHYNQLHQRKLIALPFPLMKRRLKSYRALHADLA
jgi:hypothetical protein